MRLFLYVLATVGYFLCLVWALVPTLCIGEPFWAFALMGVFAAVAVASGEGTQRGVPALALIFAVAGSIHAYRYNSRVIAARHESWRLREVRRLQETQQIETNALGVVQTNQVDATQTNQVASPEPKQSAFNCCP